MASGDLSRIENAFAEAVLDSGLWSRALNTAETLNFRTTPLPLGSVGILGALIPGMDAWSARSGSLAHQATRSRCKSRGGFDMRPSTPSRRKISNEAIRL